MYGKIASAALIGLSAVANAAPWGGPSSAQYSAPQYSASTAAQYSAASPSKSSAVYSTAASSSYMASSTGSSSSNGTNSVFNFPLANGFPNIKNPSAQLNKIQKQAGGTLPNGPPPPSLQGDSEVSLGFIAFNELFEVAFFSELISNITMNVPGYTDIPDRDFVLRTLKVVCAQEELHELNANGAFNAFTGKTILPCTYDFPVDNFMDAIALASTFTDVVLATLPDIQTLFANVGDNGLIRGVGSVIGQEGEQNGFYREILGKVPSQLPFLTGGARDFAFSAILQNFVVPGSCPSQSLLQAGVDGGDGLTLFGKLNVLTPNLSLQDVQAKFSIQTVDASNTQSWYNSHQNDKLFMTYINQQNVPISVPVEDLSFAGNAITFTASFPGASQFLNGLTIAAVTNSDGPFASPDDVAADTIFGPGLIEIN